MKSCPTSNMNKSQLWGFEVSHIVASFTVLASSNVILNILKAPLLLSWAAGVSTLAVLRFVSHGQKNGHLEMLLKFNLQPRIYFGHSGRNRMNHE
jgi:hypothetical protein